MMMRKFICALLFVPVLVFGQTANIQTKIQKSQPGIVNLGNKGLIVLDSIATDSTGIRSIGSLALSKEMVPGWNVGNSLEASPLETSWGNPLISQRLIDSIKTAGFKAVRIPVAWSSHFSDAASFTIDPTFMARVEEVVKYVLNDNMYAIINIHWDGGWMQPLYTQQTYVNNRLMVMWKQIATRFRDYDDHLIFAGTNEVMVTNNYNAPTTEYAAVQNSFNQTFVNAVRSTGGRNYYRYLAVQGFNTNIDFTNSYFIMPTDKVAKRLLAEVHYYDPYNYTLNTNSTNKIYQWGKYATVASQTETWANESYADGQFKKMKTKFVDNGYGVIIGEYGAVARTTLGNHYDEIRRYYINYITNSIEKNGLVPFYWDNGGTGNYGMGIFTRSSGAQAFPKIVKAINDTVVTYDPQTSVNTIKKETLRLYPNPANDVINIEYTGDFTNNGEIFNSNGQLVRILCLNKGLNRYSITELNPGLYLVQIPEPDGIISQKMVKE